MKNKFVQLLTQPIFKSTVLSVFPLVYGITYPLSLTNGWSGRNARLFDFSVILTIFDLIVVVLYTIYDLKNKKQYEEYVEQNKNIISITRSSKALDNLIKDVSLDLYDKINKKVNHSYVKDWTYVENKGDFICINLLELVKKLAKTGDDFSVSIFFKQKLFNPELDGFRMVARQSDHNSDNPHSYHNFVSEKDAEGMYYKKVFDNNPSKANILCTKEEIEANFKDSASKDFSQYIALPIKCKNNIVAVLQIVAYNNSKIGHDKKAIKKMCDDYFSLFANSILLIDKVENASQIINEQNQ